MHLLSDIRTLCPSLSLMYNVFVLPCVYVHQVFDLVNVYSIAFESENGLTHECSYTRQRPEDCVCVLICLKSPAVRCSAVCAQHDALPLINHIMSV